jgi:hypothetical protein
MWQDVGGRVMAEKEYIEREAFREFWNKEFRHLYPNDKYLVALANFPTADVVEVVRCKDCKHGKKIDTKTPPFRYYRPDCIVCECEDVVGDEPMIYLPTHFCSYGVKNDGKDDMK